jgi:hypothetical protein
LAGFTISLAGAAAFEMLRSSCIMAVFPSAGMEDILPAPAAVFYFPVLTPPYIGTYANS